MIREITIYIGNEKLHAFLKPGFFDPAKHETIAHQHLYSEIHFMVHGRLEFQISQQHIEISEGDMLVIPPGLTHIAQITSESIQRIAFQISKPVSEIYISHPGKDIARMLANEIQVFACTQKNPRLSYYLALIICELPGYISTQPVPLTDRKSIIFEFFSDHYNEDISLTDIATLLSVSTKQAARLVKQYTGNNFRSELTRQRINAARYLITNTDMKLTEIAYQVGYKSYSGFWKAFNNTPASSFL